MGSNKSKRIGSFKDFLMEQRLEKINEEKLSVEVEWWDNCIVQVLTQIETEAQGMVWDNIIKFCRNKWSILGRELPLPDYDDNILTQHIKDLIFQFYGDSFYTDWKCDYGWDNQQVHSKGLVIEELAAVILNKIKEKTKPSDEMQSDDPVGTLSSRQPITMVPMTPAPSYDDDYEDQDYDDLPFERKQVYGFEKYSKLIEEAKTQFRLANQQKVIDYTLDKLEQEAGSLKLNDIAQVVVMKYGAVPDDEGYVIFGKYIKSIVMDYLYSKEMVQVLVKKNKDLCISRNVLDGIYNLFAEMVVEEIQHMLVEKDKKEKEVEDAEVE